MNQLRGARRQLCIVNPFQHGGGAEYQINCLIDVLKPMGRYDIYYLARYTDPQVAADRYRVVQIGDGGALPMPGYLVDAVPLYRALDRIRPDVIYQRVACGYTGVCAYYARARGARMVWHIAHDSDVSRDSSFHGRNPLRRFLEKRSIEYGIAHTTHIIAQTETQSALLASNYGRAADVVIPNFQPAAEEELDKAGPLTVVWVANLKPWKRPEVFVRLAAALADISNVRFVMAGASHEGGRDREWGDALRRSIAAATNLEYVGQLSQGAVNALLARSHIFVNTSVQEGFPNTFIQAWMREVPVVSLTVNPDGVLDREPVGLFGGTEEGLQQAVRLLLTDPDTLRRLALASCAYAMRKHSLGNAGVLAEFLDSDGRGAVAGSRSPDRQGSEAFSGRT